VPAAGRQRAVQLTPGLIGFLAIIQFQVHQHIAERFPNLKAQRLKEARSWISDGVREKYREQGEKFQKLRLGLGGSRQTPELEWEGVGRCEVSFQSPAGI